MIQDSCHSGPGTLKPCLVSVHTCVNNLSSDHFRGKNGKRPEPAEQTHRITPTHSHKAAHLGSSRGVPDLHDVIVRPAHDALPVPRKSDAPHHGAMPSERAHLPTRRHLRPLPTHSMIETSAGHPHQSTTLIALLQSCSPRLRSRRSRSSRNCPDTRSLRCASHPQRSPRSKHRLCAPAACAAAEHPRFSKRQRKTPQQNTAAVSPQTQRVHPPWLLTSVPVATSQILRRLSPAPLTMRLPSREIATERTWPPLSVFSCQRRHLRPPPKAFAKCPTPPTKNSPPLSSLHKVVHRRPISRPLLQRTPAKKISNTSPPSTRPGHTLCFSRLMPLYAYTEEERSEGGCDPCARAGGFRDAHERGNEYQL